MEAVPRLWDVAVGVTEAVVVVRPSQGVNTLTKLYNGDPNKYDFDIEFCKIKLLNINFLCRICF